MICRGAVAQTNRLEKNSLGLLGDDKILLYCM